MLGVSVASLVAWSVLAAFRISFVEMHLLLLVAAIAYLVHVTRARDRDERSVLPLRNRKALRDARRSRKRSRQQRVLDPDELEERETGRWHMPDDDDDPDGFVRARGSRMTIRDADIATRDAILDLLSDTEVASVTTSSTTRDLNPGDEFVDLEHVELGIRRASGVAPPPGYVLPRCAVSDETWRLVVSRIDVSSSKNT